MSTAYALIRISGQLRPYAAGVYSERRPTVTAQDEGWWLEIDRADGSTYEEARTRLMERIRREMSSQLYTYLLLAGMS